MKFLMPLVAILIASCSSNPSVSLTGDLAVGTETTGSLEKETPKSYSITVPDNTFITGYVDQVSVDVIVSLFNEADEEIDSFDNPAEGHEPFNFSIEEGGTYRFEVAPFEEGAGDYSVMISLAEAIATDRNSRADQLMALFSNDVPGGVIGIIEDGKMVYSKAYGKANLTHDLDFKVNTPTNIGSVSKQFTSYAILLLEERGLLSVDDDIHDHFPELPDYGALITVANLMNHTNGLREVYNYMPMKGWYGEDALLREEVINIVKNQKELQDAPNTEFNYNNSAYIMLAEIVERKTDTLFPVWMKHNVFDPLGMTNSYVRSDPSQIIPNASQGYSTGEHGYIENGDLAAAYGAGGIYTTPEDLAKWLANFNEPVVGSAATIKKLTTPRVLVSGDTLDYAFGIGVGEYRGLTRYAHGGADIAHRAMMTYFPEINSGVITLSNNAGFDGGMAGELIDLYFEDKLESEDAEEGEEEAEETGEFTVSDEILNSIEGTFKFEEIPMMLEFTVIDGVLNGEPTGQEKVELVPTSDSIFINEELGVELIFKAATDGSVDTAAFSQGGANFTLNRLPPYSPTLEELDSYTGTYFSIELEVFYTLKVKDSILVASMRNVEDITLSTAEKDNFTADVFYIAEMVFSRDDQGIINGFEISNGRTKGIKFEKR
ncbi:MAG: serine hydrolase domain-containing protein [Gilvibacter sp.]